MISGNVSSFSKSERMAQLSQSNISCQKNENNSPCIEDKVDIGSKNETRTPSEWTILFYGAGDNDLHPAIIREVNELESAGSTAKTNIVVDLDVQNGEQSDCKTFFIEKDNDPNLIYSKVLKDNGSVNMADPQHLADFIKFGVENYPAKNYALVIADHGMGWRGAIKDFSHDGWMSVPQLREGIEKGLEGTGKKLDVLGFDACLMASTEAAYELKDTAKFLVGSEETEGAYGWSFPDILKKIEESPDEVTPENFAKTVISCATEKQGRLPTMSAIDLSKMQNVADATNNFSQAIIDSDTPSVAFRQVARKTQALGDRSVKDFYDFAKLTAESPDIKDKNIKDKACELMETLKETIIAEQHSPTHPGAHGLNLEIPSFGRADKEGYDKLMFAKDTKWDEAMKKMKSSG